MSYSEKFGSRLNLPFESIQIARALDAVGGTIWPSRIEALDEVALHLQNGSISWEQASILSRLIRDGQISLALYSLRHNTLQKVA